jgi:nitrogenase molybdenum-iron protein NifN
MAEIVLPTKALTVNPLKTSQPIGASLAILGLAEAMPLEHGARGCTSFNKLFFMRHFRDPIALQTTAMDQLTTVLGADGNVVEALATICAKDKPEVIGLITTGLSEVQGADVPSTVRAFRQRHPDYDGVAIVQISASDTFGNLETGFAAGVEAILDTLVPQVASNVARPRQVNVLPSAMLTPGDVEAVKDWIAAFGLSAVVVPDIADSLDGHLTDDGYRTLTYGGAARASIATMAESVATLVIGPSLDKAADALRERTGIADWRFSGLMSVDECDAFSRALSGIAGVPVPAGVQRKRAQLLDAMVDTQFQIGGAKIAIAADPDLLATLVRFYQAMGAEIVAAVASARAEHLAMLPLPQVVVGDLEDFEWLVRETGAEMIVTNSHGAEIAKRTKTTLFRAGFPLYDSYGAHARVWTGYGGARSTLFDTANLLAAHYRELAPYRSIYWQGTPRDDETDRKAC